MDLNEEQKNAVKSWVEDGATLSDVQKRISSDFGITMTYMDVRFLVIDIGAEVKDKEEPVRKEEEAQEADVVPHNGGVSVEVDRVTSPGAIVSGSVVFSDGTSATWGLDQMGRLALDAGDPEYRPSEEDIAAFQEELNSVLESRGF